MAKWEYALLVRRRAARLEADGWEVTFHWYGPDGSSIDVTPYGDTALAHLNRLPALLPLPEPVLINYLANGRLTRRR